MFSFKAKPEQDKNKGSILIVDYEKPWQNSLFEILRKMNYRVELAGSYEDAKNLLAKTIFDVAVVEPRLDIDDTSNLDGMRLVALIRNTRQSKNTIIYTAFPTIELIEETRKYQILDFVDKAEHPEYIVVAIEKAMSVPPTSNSFPHLTISEQEVLELVVNGKSDREIAKETERSDDTIKKHVGSILAKLGVEGRAQLVKEAVHYHLTVTHHDADLSSDVSSVNPLLRKKSKSEYAGPITQEVIRQSKRGNQFRYLLQTAIDLYAKTQKRNFSDVLSEIDDQLGYGRNSTTIQKWLQENTIPNAAEVEYFAKKITGSTNLDKKWIKDLFDAAGYKVPGYLVRDKKRLLRVFLCHAHNDAGMVRDLFNRLITSNIDAWLDKEKLLPGSDWEYEIPKAVREADVVVVCLSKNFNQKGFRQKEVRIALDVAMEQPEGEIFIIPARLEECENLESLKKWHWVNLYEADGYEKLIRALKTRAQKVGASFK